MKKIVLAAFLSLFVFSNNSYAMLSKNVGRFFSQDSIDINLLSFFSEDVNFSKEDFLNVVHEILELMKKDGINADLPEKFWQMDR